MYAFFNATQNLPNFLPIKSYIMGFRSLLAGSSAWAFVATSAVLAEAVPAPPCFGTWPGGQDYETMCFSIVSTSGNITVRDYATLFVPLGPVIASTPSTYTNFSAGSTQATGFTIDYFLYNNDKVEKIPLTTPLIWRPDQAGTWVATFALPASKFKSAATAPGPSNGATDIDVFSNKRVAAYGFYTIELATEDDYAAACASLSSWLAGQSIVPVPGAWAEAWVTYNTLAQVGDRYNECWAEIPTSQA